MMDLNLITEEDYNRSKSAILDDISSPKIQSPSKADLMAAFEPEPQTLQPPSVKQQQRPPELDATSPSSRSVGLPDINAHRSPTKGMSPGKSPGATRRLGKQYEIPMVRGINVHQAITMIQDKIQGRLTGGPAGLRRAFQFFDSDGSGAISHDEFKEAIRLKCMLVLEDHILAQVMQKFDPEKTGEINYHQFCQLVMNSKNREPTSFTSQPGASEGRGAALLEPKKLMRMIRESSKDLRTAFSHLDTDGTGAIPVNELRYALSRYNIEMSDRQFDSLMKKIDSNNDGVVSYQEFLKYFRKTEISDANDNAVGVVSGMSVDKAIQMIRDKIQQRLEGGPAGLRRAFQYFDTNGSGTISHDEFRAALKNKTMLVFDKQLATAIMKKFDPMDRGQLDFQMFCDMVMGSNARDHTSFSGGSGTNTLYERNNWELVLKRRVLEHAKMLKSSFQHLDRNGNGRISIDDLKHTLFRCDMAIGDQEFDELMTKMAHTGAQQFIEKGEIVYINFLDYFKKAEIAQTQSEMMATVSGISVDAAITLIQDKIQQKLEGGPAGLRRAFQYFDEDGSGAVSLEEFAKAMRMRCMLVFEPKLLADVMARFDPDQSGEVTYNKFVELVMGSKARDATSFSNKVAMGTDKVTVTGNDARNFERVVRQKVLECWRELKHLFTHLDDLGTGQGSLPYEDMRYALERHNIMLTDHQFTVLMKKIDANMDGRISAAEFLTWVKEKDVQDFRDTAISEIRGISVDKAVTLIRDKIQQKLEGGPAGLRRAFQHFDEDGSGGIDFREFKQALRMRAMLVFEEKLAEQIFRSFGLELKDGVIDYNSFCQMVMGSGARDGTSFGGLTAGATAGLGDYAGLEEDALISAMQRKVRESWKELWHAIKSVDRSQTGMIPAGELRYLLQRYNIIVSDLQWKWLMEEVGIEAVDEQPCPYGVFLSMFPPYH